MHYSTYLFALKGTPHGLREQGNEIVRTECRFAEVLRILRCHVTAREVRTDGPHELT